MPEIREFESAAFGEKGYPREVPLEPALRASTVTVGTNKALHASTRFVMVASGDTAFKYDVNTAALVSAATGTTAPTGTWFFGVKPASGDQRMVFATAAV